MSTSDQKDHYNFDYVQSNNNQQPMLQSVEIDCGPTLTIDDIRMESRLVMKRLTAVTCVSCTFMCCEFIGGWLSNSLAILTDAAHLLSDVSGFVISIFSIWVGLVPAKRSSLSYGYVRAEIIGALTSVLIIWALTVWLVIEAVNRVVNPTPVNGLIMTITSIIGLCCNLVMGLILNTNICGKIEIEPRISKMSRMKKEEDLYLETKKTMELEGKPVHERKTENPNLRAAVIHIMGNINF
jgi:zinc transporter 2